MMIKSYQFHAVFAVRNVFEHGFDRYYEKTRSALPLFQREFIRLQVFVFLGHSQQGSAPGWTLVSIRFC